MNVPIDELDRSRFRLMIDAKIKDPLKNLILDKDKSTLHDMCHLAPRIDHKWCKLTPLIPKDLTNNWCSFFRDLEKFLKLMKELGV